MFWYDLGEPHHGFYSDVCQHTGGVQSPNQTGRVDQIVEARGKRKVFLSCNHGIFVEHSLASQFDHVRGPHFGPSGFLKIGDP